jgi:nitroreductase/dihydropteridine reductase
LHWQLAAELKIDSCPMEGFLPKEVDKLLKLPKYLKSIVMLPVGYRAQGPTRPKFRYPKSDLFSTR